MVGHKKAWKTIWNIPRLLKKAWELFRNPKVPSYYKLLLFILGLGYVIWPFDLIPDVPLIGQIDDLGILFLLLNWFVNRSMPEDFIEAEYYYKNDDEKSNK